eukprot:1153484-Pelagomonas_calceolata.AAC.2
MADNRWDVQQEEKSATARLLMKRGFARWCSERNTYLFAYGALAAIQASSPGHAFLNCLPKYEWASRKKGSTGLYRWALPAWTLAVQTILLYRTSRSLNTQQIEPYLDRFSVVVSLHSKGSLPVALMQF